MPLYAYRCEKCGNEEEHIQRFSDDPITECSACGGLTKRVISAGAFHLKGGGWYADGYASTGGGSSKDSGGGSSDSSGSSGSSDGGGSKASGE